MVRLRIARYLTACLLACVRSAAAQTAGYEGQPIANIQFSPADQPLTSAELANLLPLKKGAALHLADVHAAIQRLYATGDFEDIQVDAELLPGGVTVRIITKNSWFVGNVAIEGRISDPPNGGQLVNVTRLNLGQPFEERDLEPAQNDMKRLLDNNGLYRSQVRPEVSYDPKTQQVSVHFVLDPGPRAHFTTPAITGDTKMPLNELVGATHWRRWLIGGWHTVNQSRVRKGLEGVRSRYERRGRFEARVALKSMDYDADGNRSKPSLDIDAGPLVEVHAIGAKVSQGKLRSLIPVFEEHSVDESLLFEGSRNLRDYFQSQGYFDAEVEYKPQRIVNDKASIDYLINPGTRHRLVWIGIEGNKYFRSEAIRERMFLMRASLLQFRRGRYSGALLRRDEDSIGSLYKMNGFRDVAVKHKIVDGYRGKKGDLAVFLQIAEGPQYLVHSLDIQGIAKLDKARLLSQLSSDEGQPFSEYNVAVDRDVVLGEYSTRGFPNATFEWSSKPAPDAHQVDLTYVVHEGQQQFVRDVLISGLKGTRRSMVDSKMELKRDDPLSPNAMRDTQRQLYDLGVFARVDTAIQNPDGDTDSKYVLYDVEEARKYSIATGFGAEFAKIGGCSNCLEAPAGQNGFAPDFSLDVSRLDLWGLGQSLSFRGRVSTLDQRALVDYTAPRVRGNSRLTLSFTALYDNSKDVRTFTAQREEGSVQLADRLSKSITFLYRYTYRHVIVDQSTLKISPLLIPLFSQPDRVGEFSWSMIQDRRDDPIDTHKGIYNTMDISAAPRAFGSQISFGRFLGRNATYHPIGRKYVLARATSFGIIHPLQGVSNPLTAIPLPEHFFSGGATSERGFPDLQAGPRDPVTGFPLGGTALLMNQTELRFPLLGENIGGVLFHDMGNVYSSPSSISFRTDQHGLGDFDYMNHAVGFGIRYRTPIGPVRLDLAYSINPPRFFGFQGSFTDLLNAGVKPCSPPPGQIDRCVAQGISHFQFFFSIGQTF
ncbi:MAG TPA: POTRA domain-containing protein [Bryobacteraceae bacterium]|nr:POTRA domain-containing protein [Bryobacteraceae bacterium]